VSSSNQKESLNVKEKKKGMVEPAQGCLGGVVYGKRREDDDLVNKARPEPNYRPDSRESDESVAAGDSARSVEGKCSETSRDNTKNRSPS